MFNNTIIKKHILFLILISEIIFPLSNSYATNIIYQANKSILTFNINNQNIEETVPVIPVIPIISTVSEVLNENKTSDEIISTDSTIFLHDGVKYKKGKLMGNFMLTGYCTCQKCTGGSNTTYSGKPCRANHTIAADLSILPLGTFIILEGTKGRNDTSRYNGVYQVEDKGGGVKNKHIDIYQPTHDEACLVTYHGKSYADVFIAVPIE